MSNVDTGDATATAAEAAAADPVQITGGLQNPEVPESSISELTAHAVQITSMTDDELHAALRAARTALSPDPERILALYAEMLRRAPDDVGLHINIAHTMEDFGRFAEALLIRRRIRRLECDPKNEWPIIMIREQIEAAENKKNSIDIEVPEALPSDAEYAVITDNLLPKLTVDQLESYAYTALRAQDYQQAVRFFRELVIRRPTLILYRGNLVSCFDDMNDMRNAEIEMGKIEQYVAAFPPEGDGKKINKKRCKLNNARNSFSHLYARMQRETPLYFSEAGTEILCKCTFSRLQDYRKQAYAQYGCLDAVIDISKEMIMRRPEERTSYIPLVMAYERAGEFVQAIKVQQQVDALDSVQYNETAAGESADVLLRLREKLRRYKDASAPEGVRYQYAVNYSSIRNFLWSLQHIISVWGRLPAKDSIFLIPQDAKELLSRDIRCLHQFLKSQSMPSASKSNILGHFGDIIGGCRLGTINAKSIDSLLGSLPDEVSVMSADVIRSQPVEP